MSVQTNGLSIKGLNEKKIELKDKLQNIKNSCEKEKRARTDQEKQEWDFMQSDLELIEAAIKEKERASAEIRSDITDPVDEDGVFQIGVKVPEDRSRPISSWVQKNFDVPEASRKADPYKVIVALGAGKARRGDKITEAALQECRSISGGSNIIDTYLSSQVLETMLAKSHLATSGMKVIAMPEKTHSIGRISTYPVFEWMAEGATQTEKSAGFDAVSLSAKTLRAWSSVTMEFLQDAVNASDVLRRAFTLSGANEIDRAGLLGSGVGQEPLGVFNMEDVSVYEMGANGGDFTGETDPSNLHYDAFVNCIKLILDSNGEIPNTAIMSTREWQVINKFIDTTNQPLTRPDVLKNMAFKQSSKIPITQTQGSANNASSIFLGNFNSLVLGTRMEMTVGFTPIAADTAKYSIFCAWRGDFTSEYEPALGVIKGIIPVAA